MIMEASVQERESVVFLTKEHANTTFIIKRKTEVVGRSGEGVPITEIVGTDKTAVFHQGLCQTDDSVVIAWLEKREGVWRADDPLAGLKMEHGDAQIEEITEAVRGTLMPTEEGSAV